MVNRGIRGQYPAGSIFKIVTALAALRIKRYANLTNLRLSGFFNGGRQRFGC